MDSNEALVWKNIPLKYFITEEGIEVRKYKRGYGLQIEYQTTRGNQIKHVDVDTIDEVLTTISVFRQQLEEYKKVMKSLDKLDDKIRSYGIKEYKGDFPG